MVKRVPWDQYEAALLIDAYYRIDEKKIDRRIAVELISSELRKKAENENKEIDKIFRNTNGINMRFYEIQFIATGGKAGMKNTSRLFVDTVGMYKTDKQHFGEVYSQALSKVYAGTDFEHFMLWIDKSAYAAHRKRIEYASRMIYSFGEEYALGINTKYDLGIATGVDAYSDFLNSTSLKKENKKVSNVTNEVELRAKSFSKWMIDTRKLSVATARGYSSAINTATPYAQSICNIGKSIYAIDDVGELENVLKTLMHDKGFADLNAQSHNRFRGAFDKYLQYMLSCNGEITNTGFVEQQESGSYEEIEEMVKAADVEGISSNELSNKTGKSIWLINKYLRKQEYAVEVPGEIYINLLMKPVTHMALAHVAYFAKQKGIAWEEVVTRLNQVDWSMDNSVWFNILVIPAKKKKVITGKESIRAAGMVISYMVMGKAMTAAEVNEVREIIRNSTNGQSDELPEMIGGQYA